MFCDRCGNAVTQGQTFCSSCGKSLAVPAAPPALMAAAASQNRVANHVQVLGILWLVAAALQLLPAVFLYMLGKAFVSFGSDFPPGAPPEVRGLIHLVFSCIAFFLFIMGAAAVIAGWGLLKREPWARILAVVLGFVSLLHFPFGTALGIYTIWVLLSANAEREYQQLSASV